ncbi:UbiA prenyltransferase family protein [Candidatus Nomurabacteria bacterium]|nr:UbiA prenyltransferase family protein [Candidatus Nomurabacteria bacterium]
MKKMRQYAQSLPITFESWIISFVGIVIIRTFFEQYPDFSKGHFVLIDLPTILHYGISYLAISLCLMCILMFFSKIKIQEALAVGILGSSVILLAPVIDLIAGGIGGYQISYFFLPMRELLFSFLTFFGWHTHAGITLGIQIETILGIIFCYIYVHTTTNTHRAIGAAVAFYCLIFFIFSLPSLAVLFATQQIPPINAIVQSTFSSHIIQNNIHPAFTADNLGLFDLAFNKIMIGINTLVAMGATIFLFFLGTRKKLQVMIKNSRPERIFHFFLLFLFGSALVHASWFANWVDVQVYLLAFISFICAWMFCVCQNDIYDEKIDSLSNKDRPVISKDLSKDDMQVVSKIFLLFTFLTAYAASHYILFFVSMFLFVYYIYSNPPLRLKRFVILNSFLVSLACLAIILAGFFLVNNDKSILAFPPGLVLAIIIFFSAVTNIRDIKDFEGDKADGIKTLPVLLGLKKSQKLIAGIICFFFLLIPWYFKIPSLFIPSIVAVVFSWYFITKEDYVEWKGFVIYMIYLILIIGVFILR